MTTKRWKTWTLGLTAMLVTSATTTHAQLFASDSNDDTLVRVEDNGSTSTVGPFGTGNISGMFFHEQSETLYAIDNGSDNLVIINTHSGAASPVGALGTNVRNQAGLTFDANSGTTYFIRGNGGGSTTPFSSTLFTVNLGTGAASNVGNSGIAGQAVGAAYDNANDILYAITNNNSGDATNNNSLFTVNTSDGSMTRVGGLGIEVGNGGLTFDKEGRLMLIRQNNPDGLYEVDTVTGTAELFTNIPNGTNGVALSLIPEPSTAAALILAVGFLSARRRFGRYR